MHVTLPDRWAKFVRKRVTGGAYSSPEDVLAAALQALRERSVGNA